MKWTASKPSGGASDIRGATTRWGYVVLKQQLEGLPQDGEVQYWSNSKTR